MSPEFPAQPDRASHSLWPAIPADKRDRLSGILEQLERSQWEDPRRLLRHQFQQMQTLFARAVAHIPYYRERFRSAGIDASSIPSPGMWRHIPILTKNELRRERSKLQNPVLQGKHGRLGGASSSGSTGIPVTVTTTGVTRLFWSAFTLREIAWHQRDVSLKLGAIRYFRSTRDAGSVQRKLASWGPPVDKVTKTGPAEMLSIMTPVNKQLQWLAESRPNLLVTYPSNALELARQSSALGLEFPFLREIILLGETAGEEVRDTCRAAWNVPVTDTYTANEVGYIALQCPACDHYHVQSENLYLEVLDEDNRPCAADQIGRVVITSLQNFAQPLIRYEIGDYAEPGPPCPCGRGLPVLKRILGRTRNMLVLPTGERLWPQINASALDKISSAVRQAQFIQRSLDRIEVRYVGDRPLTAPESEKIAEKLRHRLQYPFEILFTRVDKIERSKAGKFEEFKSEVADAPAGHAAFAGQAPRPD